MTRWQRNIRRESNDNIKRLLKEKKISEDESKNFEKEIQTGSTEGTIPLYTPHPPRDPSRFTDCGVCSGMGPSVTSDELQKV